MKILENMKAKGGLALGKSELFLKENEPTIYTAFGILGVIGTVVLACRATLKASKVLERHDTEIEDLKEEEARIESGDSDYSLEELKTDKIKIYGNTAKDLIFLYAPSAALGAVSTGLIVYSNKIWSNRYMTALSAFNAATTAFETYRGRIRKELGEEFDRHILTGSRYDKELVVEVNEKGKTKTTEQDVELIDQTSLINSGYVRWFDSTNPNWDQNTEFSMMFLRAQQDQATNILRARGYIFLNEVFDMLGMEGSQIGALTGWKKGLGDDFVDFGLYDPRNESARRFINGDGDAVLLNFNVDGVIWDHLGRIS